MSQRANITPGQLQQVLQHMETFRNQLNTLVAQNQRFVTGLQTTWNDHHYAAFCANHKQFMEDMKKAQGDLDILVTDVKAVKQAAEEYLRVKQNYRR